MRPIIEKLTIPFFTVLFIFIFLYVFSLLFGPLPLQINSTTTTKSDMFSVTGVGEIKSVPQEAQFTVGVTKSANTSELAKSQMTEVSNKIIEALKNLGIEEKDIKTINLNVYPNREFSGRNDISGYTAAQDLQVSTDNIDLANRALDAATAAGANQVSGVTFALNDESREEAEASARAEAINDAKEKAQTIAREAGLRLGRIVNVQVSSGGQPPVFFEAKAMDQAASNVTQIQPGENTTSVSVTLSYETL